MSAANLIAALTARGLTLATAESCTGGLVAAALTEIPGASATFTHGFVTYANAAKTSMLGVPASLLATHGAVSPETAAAMAQGARAQSGASLALSTTGIAGPTGGSPKKPVGTVWFGLASSRGVATYSRVFPGDRAEIRRQATDFALALLLEEANTP
ncbi:CinA family protein [Acidocella sp.]|uniref:CinA family protein n=1 Tax=Acidocella sp. TaxID=50710 RepID=UPI00261F0B6B|nr:CinA family protein [Acidocella sp.]